MRIAILGGGPGGLYLACLLKDGDPRREVSLWERNRPDDTFGFGVVFSDATMRTLASGDAWVRRQLDESAVQWEDIEVRHRGRRLRCGGNGFAAISRRRLLQVLQQRCRELEVDLRFQREATVEDAREADLVVAADGANSRTRQTRAEAFQPDYHVATAKFIWLGTAAPFDALTFLFAESEHGWFAVHAYPFDKEAGNSTFIVETDEPSWRAAGLDGFDASQPPGRSDLASKAYLEALFAEHLGGHGLLVNNSRWGNFRTLRCRRWSSRRVTLLGDAAHTAHFSVGSGTKMAMEDALALAQAVDEEASVEDALDRYESVRQPQVARIQRAARPSLAWWEHFGQYASAFEPEQFAFHFLTRSGRIGRDGLAVRDERFVREVEDWFQAERGAGEDFVELVLPIEAARSRADVELRAPATEAALPTGREQAAAAVQAGARVVAVRPGLTGAERTDESSLCARLMCEHVRLRLGAQVVLLDPDLDREWALTMVLSGRCDLVGVAC